VKLAISNIAWPPSDDDEVIEFLPNLGVGFIEIAPTRVWQDWGAIAEDQIQALRDKLGLAGLRCSSLQAVLFGKPELRLFGNEAQRAELCRHLKTVADLASALGAGPMVFGAPKNRNRGSLSEREAFRIAADFFGPIGDYCAAKDTCLCLEPNPAEYGCDFITDSRSGADLVRTVGSPGFRLHLDAAGMHLAGEHPGEAVESAADVLAHVHISEPNLGNFRSPVVDHLDLARGLRAICWDKPVAIEMRASSDSVAEVKIAVDYVERVYGGSAGL
jgi:sugar phosphate isomerase/epimerase